MGKEDEYTKKLLSAIQTCFDQDSENKIDLDELSEGNNATDFMHALFNTAPTFIYNRIADEDANILECNHIANKLVFQYANKKEDEGE